MMEEWDEHMADFVPNDMLSVKLNPREEIVSKDQILFPFIIHIFTSLFTRTHQTVQFTSEGRTLLMLPQAPKRRTD
jgi:hypothetical protein